MINSQKKIWGPFTEILPMTNLPATGPIRDASLKILKNAGILTEDDKILVVDDFEKLKKENSKTEVIEFSGDTVVLPGFIDVHTHILFAGTRARDYALRTSGAAYTDILKAGGGIHESVRLTTAASAEDLEKNLLLRLNRHLADGVTTVEVKTGYGLLPEEELRQLRILKKAAEKFTGTLVPTCLAAHVIPKDCKTSQEAILRLIHDLLPKIKNESLTRRLDIFVEEGAFSADDAKNYANAAKNFGFDITVHADQFSRSGAKVAAEIKAISADHLEASQEEDFLLLKNANVIPVSLPGASLGLGMSFAPARKILDLGLPLVIASDWNPGSAPMGDLLLQACVLGAAQKLTLAETLAALTTRAAKVLRLSDRGELSSGGRADFSMFPCADYREIFWHQGRLKPTRVVCGGK